MSHLFDFVKQSDNIEGIFDLQEHTDALHRTEAFLAQHKIELQGVVDYNTAGPLRIIHGMDVWVGNHSPPIGGPEIKKALESIIWRANRKAHPYSVHHQFETLHPFMDGNGRTGRVIWLWQMVEKYDYDLSRLFLQQWYYQSLNAGPGREE